MICDDQNGDHCNDDDDDDTKSQNEFKDDNADDPNNDYSGFQSNYQLPSCKTCREATH